MVSFVEVNWLKKILSGLRKNLKFSISNPKNFEEVWSFNSNGFRVISLMIILLLLTSLLIAYLMGGDNSYFGNSEVSIEREQLEAQNQRIEELTGQISAQENYISKIKLILSGEVPVDTPLDSLDNLLDEINLDSLELKETDNEKKLAQEIKEDMMTSNSDNESISFFGSPITGVVSQTFNKLTHPGIDVVTEKDKAVKSCLAGTVIYAGYTRKDGYILIIEHANNYTSVYKHNKRVLKKVGSKVQLGDPIAIVGNTGENSDGPHLHFELWYEQNPVNPDDYMKFTQ